MAGEVSVNAHALGQPCAVQEPNTTIKPHAHVTCIPEKENSRNKMERGVSECPSQHMAGQESQPQIQVPEPPVYTPVSHSLLTSSATASSRSRGGKVSWWVEGLGLQPEVNPTLWDECLALHPEGRSLHTVPADKGLRQIYSRAT